VGTSSGDYGFFGRGFYFSADLAYADAYADVRGHVNDEDTKGAMLLCKVLVGRITRIFSTA